MNNFQNKERMQNFFIIHDAISKKYFSSSFAARANFHTGRATSAFPSCITRTRFLRFRQRAIYLFMLRSRTSKRSLVIAGEPPSGSVSVRRARAEAKKFEGESKGGACREESRWEISGTPMRRGSSDRIGTCETCRWSPGDGSRADRFSPSRKIYRPLPGRSYQTYHREMINPSFRTSRTKCEAVPQNTRDCSAAEMNS